MKEFALIFRLADVNDFKPSPEQMQERTTWLKNIADQGKLANAGNSLLPFAGSAKTVRGATWSQTGLLRRSRNLWWAT